MKDEGGIIMFDLERETNIAWTGTKEKASDDDFVLKSGWLNFE